MRPISVIDSIDLLTLWHRSVIALPVITTTTTTTTMAAMTLKIHWSSCCENCAGKWLFSLLAGHAMIHQCGFYYHHHHHHYCCLCNSFCKRPKRMWAKNNFFFSVASASIDVTESWMNQRRVWYDYGAAAEDADAPLMLCTSKPWLRLRHSVDQLTSPTSTLFILLHCFVPRRITEPR